VRRPNRGRGACPSGNPAGQVVRHSLVILLLLCCVAPLAFGADEGALKIYVSPIGNDAWSGTLPEANPDRSDGPMATLEHARDRVRERHAKAGDRQGQTTIIMRGGRYELAAPFILTPEDSGTADEPLTICAYENERPVLSGGRRLAFAREPEGGHDVWVAPLPPGLPGHIVRELWADGHRRTRARFPVTGYLRVESSPESAKDWRHAVDSFHFHEGDLKAWPSAADAELVVMSHWVESRLPVKEIDEKEKVVSFNKKTTNGLDPGDVYFLEGAKDFLTEPGEWCQDPSSKTIRYLPLPGEDPKTVEAVVPALQQVMRLEGKSEAGRFVEHVVFRGIGFAHAQWDLPDRDAKGNPGPSGYDQADISVPGAVVGQGVRDCLFDACSLEHVGGYGLELARGCQHNKLIRCTIDDLGAGGIKIGETTMRGAIPDQTFGNEISDCRITDGGCFYPSGVGVWFGQTYDNVLSHNEIANFYYTGISIGWTWGYGKSLPKNNVVESNHVHHIGVKSVFERSGGKELSRSDGPILSDMGGIYTLGVQRGTVIRGNRFNDIAGIKYGGWGIYFDEGSTGIVAERNLVYRTTHGGLHQHYGKENIFRNNIIAFARDWQIQRTRAEDHQSFSFEHNIVYWDRGDAVQGDFKTFNVIFNHNDYWAFDKGDMKFAGLSWAQWQEKGMDRDSVIADPRFVDPQHDNFHIMDDSPALKVGFEPFNLEDVGPRKQ
jgi:hypothetical protein